MVRAFETKSILRHKVPTLWKNPERKRSKGTVKRLLFPYFQYLLPRHIETDGTRVQERGEKDVV